MNSAGKMDGFGSTILSEATQIEREKKISACSFSHVDPGL